MRLHEITEKKYGIRDFPEFSQYNIKSGASEEIWELDNTGKPVVLLPTHAYELTFSTEKAAYKYFYDPFFGVVHHEFMEAEVAKLLLKRDLKKIKKLYPTLDPGVFKSLQFKKLPTMTEEEIIKEFGGKPVSADAMDSAGGLAHDIIISNNPTAYRNYTEKFYKPVGKVNEMAFLYEITFPANKKEAFGKLFDIGFDRLGHGGFYGSYGGVFTKAGLDYGLKIFENLDLAYAAYVHYCQDNLGDIHLPKFRGKLMKVNDDYSAIRVELLTPPKLENYRHELIETMSDAYYQFREGYEGPEAKQLRKLDSSLANSVEKLAKTFMFQFRPDLNWRNVMMRGNVYVMSDPLAVNDFSKKI